MWAALEGTSIASRYELRAHLATGGMSAIFKGWDYRLSRPVAIKMLRQLEDAEPGTLERFRREARATAALRNDHIVQVYDFIEEYGCHYLVMELVDGINLKQRIFEQGPLDWREALSIGADICRALQEAHDKGFIHRDIKPQNILLDPGGIAKLTDFGIVYAGSARSITTSGIVLGTADYISPEQAQGLALQPQTDIYSLGIVLYEALTGALPYAGTTTVSVAMLHATAPVPSLREYRPDLPEDVEAIVIRALQKDPADRFASAREMQQAIQTALRSPRALAEWRTVADLLRDGSDISMPDEQPRVMVPAAAGQRSIRSTMERTLVTSTSASSTVVGALSSFWNYARANEQYRLLVVLIVAATLLLGIVMLNTIL